MNNRTFPDTPWRWICTFGYFFHLLFLATTAFGQEYKSIMPLLRTVDMDVGETRNVELSNGSTVKVELLAINPIIDSVIGAVRGVNIAVRINGQEKIIKSGNYSLPVFINGFQVDCPVTQVYMERAHQNSWGLKKDARLRLWPKDSPYIRPGTFVYPVNQKWLASFTQYSNEPVFNAQRSSGRIYYHSGLDIGGAEDMDEVYSATDGIVVSTKGDTLNTEPEDNPINPRYDVVYIRDDRGWYYRYSHLASIVPDLQLGQRVLAGQKLGMLGKEGGSGGWSHLHFEIKSEQPSGLWGTLDAYAFLWQAYQDQYNPDVLAIARPHSVIRVGEKTTLSASNSWAKNEISSYEWTLSDGSVKSGKEVERIYRKPGMYSEILRVVDIKGNYDYDFAVVKVLEEGKIEGPHIHAAFYPTTGIEPNDKVFFKVRSLFSIEGYDVWDFDDGSDPVTVKSNIDRGNHAKVGYSITSHRFKKPGDYLVKVYRATAKGTVTTHLHVKVEEGEE